MAYVDFLSVIHKATKRDYIARVVQSSKGEVARLAKKWDYEYWDGDRHTGYGGYHYDGRWRKVADAMVKHYGIKPGDKILDIGCGKAFLLYDFTQACPGVQVAGIDVSKYGLEHAKDEVKPFLQLCNAVELPFEDNSFDFVYSINTFHNLFNYELDRALVEMQRVGRKNKYICVESWRTEEEKANLLYWQLTCETFGTPREWEWWFEQTGYTGDHSFIYFE